MLRPAIPWTRPRVLWCASDNLNARTIHKPMMLLAAAAPSEVGRWRTANRWADTIPVVTFGGDDVSDEAPHPVRFNQPCGQTPWCVDNAPAACVYSLASLADQPLAASERGDLGRYLTAVALVAAHASPGPAWWILAESDEGMGAVRVASIHGACVALAAHGRQLGAAGAALANRLGVDVAVHDVSAGVQ